MIDYHIHYHPHGSSGPYELDRLEEYCRVAESRGISQIGISEHVFRFVEFKDVVGDWWNDTDDSDALKEHCERYIAAHATESIGDYLELIERGRQKGLPIVAGVELDYYPGRMQEVKKFLEDLHLDYVLGSVHWIGAWAFDNDEVLDEWQRRDPDDVYSAYFDLLLDLAYEGVADILAHPDLVKKFGHKPVRFDVSAAYERVAEACAGLGIGAEVSSAGFRMPAQEQYPSREFLEVLVQKGVQLTTSSDAHVTELVGYKIDELGVLLQSLGCDVVYGYRQRAPIPFRLDARDLDTDSRKSNGG